VERIIREWIEVSGMSATRVVVWVPFNESWEFRIWLKLKPTGTLRPGAVLLDEDPGSDSPGDRQRRLGEYNDRHYCYP